jgi:uncharacterized protein (DUF1800 family)
MKKFLSACCITVALATGSLVVSSFIEAPAQVQTGTLSFPYMKEGLTEREAAAHLLNRFTFGPRPGQVDEVVKAGLEKWFVQQLDALASDDSLRQMLSSYESLTMTNAQIVETFPNGGAILKMAVQEGLIERDSARIDKKEYRQQLKAYMDLKGYKPQQELVRQLVNQKILRATYSQNQLKEVLTDFWFNHFNVSLTKGDDRQFITAYERDAIRPNVTGRFEDLLLATAKSPAMLTYLDNFRSVASNEKATAKQKRREAIMIKEMEERQSADTNMQKNDVVGKLKKAKQSQGLNENYAREIMELHTLGVDGGYTQSDVTQAARILTGWTIYPMGGNGAKLAGNMINKFGEDRLKQQGFVHDGDFMFLANRHDDGEKTVLGTKFPSGGGYEEGVQLIHMLASHSSTAKFISKKIAVRFVSDNPPQALIDRMARTFTEKQGSIREVLLTMVSSPEFWSRAAVREKTKSPFELAISSVRGLNAKVDAPFQLYTWITKMGQQLYAYQAPTGFPDKGQYWINTGSLLNRMNFGLALASQRIPGIRFNLASLNQNHEPESAEAALKIYSRILLPERNVEETIKRLQPLLNDPELENKIDQEAGKTASTAMATSDDEGEMMMNDRKKAKQNEGKIVKKGQLNGNIANMQSGGGTNTMLSQVTGIIIGSPEFQRK